MSCFIVYAIYEKRFYLNYVLKSCVYRQIMGLWNEIQTFNDIFNIEALEASFGIRYDS